MRAGGYYLGLSRNLPSLERLVREVPVAELDFLDREALLVCLRQAALGAAPEMNAPIRLNSTLCLLSWLLQEQQRGGPREPANSNSSEALVLGAVPGRLRALQE